MTKGPQAQELVVALVEPLGESHYVSRQVLAN